MSGLARLQARIDALRWAADYLDAHGLVPNPDNLRALAEVLGEAHALVAPDYADAEPSPEPGPEPEQAPEPAAAPPSRARGRGTG